VSIRTRRASLAGVNPAQAGRPSYLPIHYGDVGDPPRVLCASSDASTPVTREWRYVTCPRCLEMGAERGAPSARARLEQLRREAEEPVD